MNKKNNSAVISLLLLLALVAVGIFWFRPNFDEVNALKVTEQARQNDIDQLNQTLNTLKATQANLAAGTEIDQQAVLAAIPERFQQDQLIIDINDISQKNGVNIGSISFSAPMNSQEAVKKATINISMTGDQDALMRLLKGLENNARKMVVKSITVQYGQTEGVSRINFNVSLETYFQKGI